MSDQMWLWARGFEGGGPQAELLRRISHWLMKEPDLEEEDLRAEVRSGQLTITRRSLSLEQPEVTITLPSGETRKLRLAEEGPAQIGRASCRERVCQSVEISVVAIQVKKKKRKS